MISRARCITDAGQSNWPWSAGVRSRGSRPSAFLGAVDLAVGDIDGATRTLEAALELARTRRTALWYEPRILATLANARLATGDRDRARALITEAHESLARGRGWRLSACDVELARVRLLAAEPAAEPHGGRGRARLPGHACRRPARRAVSADGGPRARPSRSNPIHRPALAVAYGRVQLGRRIEICAVADPVVGGCRRPTRALLEMG